MSSETIQPISNSLVYEICREEFERIDFFNRALYEAPVRLTVSEDFYSKLGRRGKKVKSSTNQRDNSSKNLNSDLKSPIVNNPTPSVAKQPIKDEDCVSISAIAPIEPRQKQVKRKSSDVFCVDEDFVTPKRPNLSKSASTGKKKTSNTTTKAKTAAPSPFKNVIFVQKSSFALYKEKEAAIAQKKIAEKYSPVNSSARPRRNPRATIKGNAFRNERNIEKKILVEVDRVIDDETKQEQFMFLFNLKPKNTASTFF